MSRRPTMYVDLARGPDDQDRFAVRQGAAALRLRVEDIKAAIARGETVVEMPAR